MNAVKTLGLVALLLVALPLVDSCSRASTDAAEQTTTPKAAVAARPKPRARVHTQDVDDLRRALDKGDLTRIHALLPAASVAGDEEPLLRARAQALEGTAVEALRLVETARAKDPTNPDVYATAAEIYAAHDAFTTAWEEIKSGEAASPGAAELMRARGVVYIARENGAEKGLELLVQARLADPDLPFIDHALAQAHLLVAKLDSSRKQYGSALMHVKASLEFDPSDVDAHRVLSELLAQKGDFNGAIAELEALVTRGEKLEPEIASLHKKAGVAALLEQDRPRALEHFATARKMGLSDSELGSGARILLEEANARVEQGVALYDKHDFDGALARFREALALEPDSIVAKNHIAVVLFNKRDFAGAASLWRAVIATARDEKLTLPEPVHLNLATALLQSGDADGARAALKDYLEHEPDGEWRARTSEMLEKLDKVR